MNLHVICFYFYGLIHVTNSAIIAIDRCSLDKANGKAAVHLVSAFSAHTRRPISSCASSIWCATA